MQPKSPLPLLAALLAGGALIFLGSREEEKVQNPEEVPTSIDYEDEDLKDALVSAAEDE